MRISVLLQGLQASGEVNRGQEKKQVSLVPIHTLNCKKAAIC